MFGKKIFDLVSFFFFRDLFLLVSGFVLEK